jgi:uncharacterized protein
LSPTKIKQTADVKSDHLREKQASSAKSENKYKSGQEVQLEILRETPLGFVASINSMDEGLLYHNEIFEKLSPGQKLPGYISKIREDGGIDLLLQAIGSRSSDQIGIRILEVLKKSGGKINITSQTPAEEIYNLFGVSKKKYKMALGGLYKLRLVKITDSSIELV